jgi:hypothetical protein
MDNLKRATIRACLEFAARGHGQTCASCRERKLEVMAEHLGSHIERKPLTIKYPLDGRPESASRRVENPAVAGDILKPEPPPTGLQGKRFGPNDDQLFCIQSRSGHFGRQARLIID